MERHDDWPQLGHFAVDPASLTAEGRPLIELLDELGVQNPSDYRGAPGVGWRELSAPEAASGGAIVFGAPTDGSRNGWRIAQVFLRDDPARRDASIHPDVLTVRPSCADRSRGLALRWPGFVRESPPQPGNLAIDIVNVGERRWTPHDDSFYVVGMLTSAGARAEQAFYFGHVSGSPPAFTLDPGEYVRVAVQISSDQWERAEPGEYEIRAAMVDLLPRTAEPLRLVLTDDVIAGQRPRRRPPTAPVSPTAPVPSSPRFDLARAQRRREQLHAELKQIEEYIAGHEQSR